MKGMARPFAVRVIPPEDKVRDLKVGEVSVSREAVRVGLAQESTIA